MTGERFHIHPSILSADFLNLQTELERIRQADAVHVDVMDNHFVPNLTFGSPVVSRIQAAATIPLDVHLMINNADYWALHYADLGVGSVTFHAEAAKAPIRLARELRSRGVKVGMALNPATSLDGFDAVLEELDMLLIMTVEPGFGGQAFLEAMASKITAARHILKNTARKTMIQVDGGITVDTIKIAAEAGARCFVAGSAVYDTTDPAAAIVALRNTAKGSADGVEEV